jgi:hypothetical protein
VVRPSLKGLGRPDLAWSEIAFTMIAAIFSLPTVESSWISVEILSKECRMPLGRSVSISPPSLGKEKCFIELLVSLMMRYFVANKWRQARWPGLRPGPGVPGAACRCRVPEPDAAYRVRVPGAGCIPGAAENHLSPACPERPAYNPQAAFRTAPYGQSGYSWLYEGEKVSPCAKSP